MDTVPYKSHSHFVFSVPLECPGVPAEILDPRTGWADKMAYDEMASVLKELFEANLASYNKEKNKTREEATAL